MTQKKQVLQDLQVFFLIFNCQTPVPGAADLFICGADLLPNAEKAGKAIGLNNMVSLDEMTEKLKAALE